MSATRNMSAFPTERESLYEERRLVITEGCTKVNKTIQNQSDLYKHKLLIDKKHLIYYCPIAKVSSTFWKRILTVITSQGKLNSPFEITLQGVKLSKIEELSTQEVRGLKESGDSFMFVRDPYARLFSGYENKLYNANLYFWKQIGSHVVHIVRKTHDIVYTKYGFDVTFQEFIKYILYLSESGRNINGHFSPMSNRCDPCSTHFNYIGKLETIADDAKYLISKWQKKFKDVNIVFEDFEKETVLDSARGHLRFLYETKRILNEIKFPFLKLMLRTWRDLQIRGLLSKNIEFPFKSTDKITREDYMNAIRGALEIPVNRTEVKLQREEALVQAYRQVPLEDMERLRKYVLQDCLLFGYDSRPAKLFDRSKPLKDEFLYLDGLQRR
ncbi:carbohydrate sulfotransferase 11-like [Mercenaria mercenaria]|uniref:carbohydrate sulfotransferase 11-like n=1 Tax=Mercenaria mercenaria TaxID=6596 RepID=UPI00234EE6B3|nr:carbohydrate sulfotransferase 11-like [Mercenaria mercenaria]